MTGTAKVIEAWPEDGKTDNSNLIRFRLKEEPLRRLTEYAEELGMSLGDTARILMLQGLARETRSVRREGGA